MFISRKFIMATEELSSFEKHVNAPLFRKEFLIEFIPERAEITICGLGFYELYINGKNVTKGFLAPYISNSNDICYYDCYDITDKLINGKNVIGICLGNGFRNPFGGFVVELDKGRHIGPLCTALYFECFGEGKTLSFEADESFLTHPSPITFDDIRMGCRYDARLEIPDWNMPDYNAVGWTAAKSTEPPEGEARLCEAAPVYARRIIKPISKKFYKSLAFAHKEAAIGSGVDERTVRENVCVFDFGINTAGITRLKIKGKPGQKITIRHGEYLINGNFDMLTTMFTEEERREIYYEYGQCDVYICRGGEEEVFVPHFKYDGFQYAFVDGILPDQIEDDTLLCIELTSKHTPRAGFASSDKTLTRLQQMTEQSDRSNFVYFPTDCPHREKNGWTGDASLSAEQLVLNYACSGSLKEWLRNIVCAQKTDGALPGIVPTGGWGYKWGNGPAWDAVLVNLTYYIYKYEGDLSVITENAEAIDKYLCYAASKRDGRGLVAYGLGDWVDPFWGENGKITAPLEVTDSLTILDISQKAAKLFETVGLTEKAERARRLGKEIRQAFRSQLVSENMTVSGNCQTSQAMAIDTGVFDRSELCAAQKRLTEIIHRDKDVNACGVIGSRSIYHVLAAMGEIDLAYKILTGTSRPCLGSWVKKGYSTLCESFSDERLLVNSRNHHFFGDISSFMIQNIAGVMPNPDLSDTKSFVIKPNVIEGVEWATGFYDAFGNRLSCTWKRENNKINFCINVPRQMYGKFIFRGFETDLKGGSYDFLF